MATPTVSDTYASVDVDALIAAAFRPAFPPAFAVGAAAATLAAAAGCPRPVGEAPEGPCSYVSVAPGRIRIGSVHLARAQRAAERALARRGKLVDLVVAHEQRQALVQAVGALVDAFGGEALEGGLDPLAKGRARSRITEWSGKSRRNMLDRLSTLDYEPFIGAGTPAMVTLTLGDEWERVAPTGAAFKALVRAFREAYGRAWGRRLAGLWKLEFQRRGAPHLHILMVPPSGVSRGGERWRQWFARCWSDLVVRAYSRTGVDQVATLAGDVYGLDELGRRMRVVHEHRKASADYREGLRAVDPKRIAVYFLKHNLLRDKEYQHVVPQAWRGEGDGPGRFWGYWGIERADELVPVTDEQARDLARTLRRWDRARGVVGVREVWRVSTSTGAVRRRRVTRRIRPMRGTAGFMLLNDGPAVALMLAGRLRS